MSLLESSESSSKKGSQITRFHENPRNTETFGDVWIRKSGADPEFLPRRGFQTYELTCKNLFEWKLANQQQIASIVKLIFKTLLC